MRTPPTPEHLTDRYVRDGAPVRVIAAETGYSQTAVRGMLRAAGIALRSRGGVPRAGQLTADVLRRRYVTEGATVAVIAAEAGVSEATVLRAMRRAQVATDKSRQHQARFTHALTRDVLEQQYVTEGRSAAAVARQVGCSAQTVLTALRRHELPVRPARPVPAPVTRTELLRHYLTEALPVRAVADTLEVPRSRVMAAIARERLPRPSELPTTLETSGLTVRDVFTVLARAELDAPTPGRERDLLTVAWALAADRTTS